jgi:hypothetical protein
MGDLRERGPLSGIVGLCRLETWMLEVSTKSSIGLMVEDSCWAFLDAQSQSFQNTGTFLLFSDDHSRRDFFRMFFRLLILKLWDKSDCY